MNYSEALEFLFNSIPNYQKSGQNALRPGLTNILTLTKHFKNPHKTFESIHVGGTNGKGSVSTSMIVRLLLIPRIGESMEALNRIFTETGYVSVDS